MAPVTLTFRATWIGTAFQKGAKGTAWAASGFDDPNSAEYGAYLFQPDGQPDGDESAYYCNPEEVSPHD